MLYVRDSAGKGRGVFSDRPIKKGERIEECPIVPLTDREADLCEQTILDSYMFVWGSGYCIVLGYGMIYNHSLEPNATMDEDHERDIVFCTALRDIPAGEEITHDYSGGERRPIIFEGGEWMYADTRGRL